MGPRSMVALLDFEKIFSFSTRSGTTVLRVRENGKSFQKITEPKYRSSWTHHSLTLRPIKLVVCELLVTLKTKKASLLRNPENTSSHRSEYINRNAYALRVNKMFIKNRINIGNEKAQICVAELPCKIAVQALGQLVSVNWTHYCAYISDLSSS